ncbi:hypothetical protein CAPTEDRAFT_213689 [Capitella teleta]|uniref:RING-type E3 ubiquitin transferase n=1 Tax=Capitella teleta TaxID=283909 RepID=R7V7T7_CAPTE|nr:hypothetical protein CAPTEDRAFT_213689 [Capitella teleta]|eukprot:ELU14923.1 hypothetical protein CAPTEDRAFT_213689 [Capitella teleta]
MTESVNYHNQVNFNRICGTEDSQPDSNFDFFNNSCDQETKETAGWLRVGRLSAAFDLNCCNRDRGCERIRRPPEATRSCHRSVMMLHWELIGAAVDAGIFLICYKLYKNASKEADLIKDMTIYEASPELRSKLEGTEGKSLPYACVQGVTQALNNVLRSRFKDEEGVIRTHSFVEHKSKRTQGYWTDIERVIKDEVQSKPFTLQNLSSASRDRVTVEEALSANHLDDALSIVYDHYEPTKDGALSRGVDRLFGEVVKGHRETEKMLGVGVHLLGLGKITLDGDKIVLSPPDTKDPYILTSLSKGELVKAYSSKARVYKVMAWVFGVVGVGFVSYFVYRNVKRYYEDYQMQRLVEQMRINRAQQMASEGNNNGDENENRESCVVCLANPRELIVLECGHLCLCGDCARELPQPRRCPICRGAVARLLPVFNS